MFGGKLMSRRRPIIKCIYCGEEREASQEHYLPRCLGKFRGFEGLNDRICAICNASFGRDLERHFCREGPVAFFRKFYGVSGRGHHGPYDPFQETRSGIAPIQMNGKLPEQDTEVRWEIIPGRGGIREMRQIAIRDKDGRSNQVLISDRMLSNPTELAERAREAGIGDAQEVRLFASKEEWESVCRLVLKAFPTARVEPKEEPREGQSVAARTKIRVTDRFARALAKIAFHYFLKNVPRYRGSEPQFDGVRTFIKTGENITSANAIDRFVRIVAKPEDQVMRSGCPGSWHGHLVVARANELGFVVWAQFFLGFRGPGFACTADLGRSPSGLIYDQVQAHRFAYFEGGQRDGYHGQMQEFRPPPALLSAF